MTRSSHTLTKNEIRDKYDDFARWYDIVEGIPEVFGIRTLRKQLARRVHGRTLEVAAGSGKNIRLLPRDTDLVAGDISEEMLRIAQRKADRTGKDVIWTLLDAEALPFRENSFDTVISTLSSCTFPDPVAAFQEMSRVCRPEGRILLLEHGRSNVGLFARYQDWRAEKHAMALGCQWNRQPVELVKAAGLSLIDCRTYFFGVFAVMEAKPAQVN
jgi:ubiquinone/menaquinone biosynthesis C-methylase UbiE